jgi:hypothetical protein
MQIITMSGMQQIQPSTFLPSKPGRLTPSIVYLSHLRLDDLRFLNALPPHAPTHNESRNRRPGREIEHSINRFIIRKQHTREKCLRNDRTECRCTSVDNCCCIYSRGEDREFVGKGGREDSLTEGEEERGAEKLGEHHKAHAYWDLFGLEVILYGEEGLGCGLAALGL